MRQNSSKKMYILSTYQGGLEDSKSMGLKKCGEVAVSEQKVMSLR